MRLGRSPAAVLQRRIAGGDDEEVVEQADRSHHERRQDVDRGDHVGDSRDGEALVEERDALVAQQSKQQDREVG